MTGDSIADAEALRKADVGLCMGSGCDVAKDNSDLVILDNDFVSIHRAIKWGRAIFDNVRKFLQFQLTINITLCFITILGGLSLGHPPLNVVQMLWVNLIMDVLGAIAIGTEPYGDDSSIRSQRISRRDKVMLPEMWRQVIVQATYQILVMMMLMYFGGLIFFDVSVNLIRSPTRSLVGTGAERLKLDTICFHTFILMNLFNQINCRVLDANEINVFKTLLNNPMFWFVLAGEVFIQQLMINLGGTVLGSACLGTAELDLPMQVTCWCLGAFSLVVNVALKQIPLDVFIRTCPDLETESKDDHVSCMLAKSGAVYRQKVDEMMSAGA